MSYHPILDAIRYIETEHMFVVELEAQHQKIKEKIIKTQQLWEKMQKIHQELAQDLMIE